MAKKRRKSKGISTTALIVLLIMVVGTALAFTGLFLDWTVLQSSSEYFEGKDTSFNQTLSEWGTDSDVEYLIPTNIFAWTAAVAVALALVLYLLKVLMRQKVLGTVCGIMGIVAVVSAVLAIVFTSLMGKSVWEMDLCDLAKSAVVPAVGCSLLMSGGIIGGGAALAGAFKG